MIESSAQKDVAYTIAKNIVDTKFADLPAKAVDIAKKSVIDTLGVIAGASGTIPFLGGLVDLVKEADGKPESTIIGFGGKVPAWMAAFANGAMAHCLDYDDLEHESIFHPSSAVVPAGCAIAQRVHPVSGEEFITAIALGQDLGIRLALSTPPLGKTLWQRTSVLNIFGCAATAGRLLKLDEEKIVDAFGIALCQSAGTMEMRYGIGTDIGGMYAAFPARGGVFSALLAQKGVAGIKSCFEGKAGLFNVYFEGKYDRTKLVSDLGSKFAGVNTGFKPWPACGVTHTYIDAILSSINENKIRPEDIDHIVVCVGDLAQRLCEPLPARQKPTSILDAKFSLPFCVAVAALKGNIVIDDFSLSAIKDPKVLEMAQRVTPKHDERLNVAKGFSPGVVEINTNQGRTFHAEVKKPYGHPENPVTWEGITNKFRDCVRHAARPIPEQNIERAIELAQKLEQVSDATEIIRLLDVE
ncbi:MmgE/PrpD family protein [Chloroflexota bacterium]